MLQIRLAPLVIIHFILKGIEKKASPAIMVNEFLSAFFKDNGCLTYIEIEFDVDDVDDKDTALNEHTERMRRLAQTLLEYLYYIFIFVLNFELIWNV
jgi:hypothetical protein